LDNPSKAERSSDKTDCVGYENISQAGSTDLEKLQRTKSRTANRPEMGRPRKPFDDQEAQVIAEAFSLYRFGARMLEVIIRKVFKKRIFHNRIHMYLKVADLAHEDPQKKKRSKWIRYEREHSMFAGRAEDYN
jgi:hypothetical protein